MVRSPHYAVATIAINCFCLNAVAMLAILARYVRQRTGESI